MYGNYVAATVNEDLTAAITPGTSCLPIGGSITFTAVPSQPGINYNYVWTCCGSSTPIPGAGSTIHATKTGTYTVSITSPGLPGCTAKKTVQVLPSPDASITSSTGSFAVCAGNSITLYAHPTGPNYSYSWSTGDMTSSITVTPTMNPTTYSVTVTDTTTGCATPVSQAITVNPLPTVSITPPNPTICPGETTTLTANPGGTGPFTYAWSGPVGSIVGPADEATVVVNQIGSYSVRVTDGNGCQITGNTTVNEATDCVPPALAIFECCPRHIRETGLVTYTISIRNYGQITATDVTLVDTLASCLTYVSATGPGWIFPTPTGQQVVGTLASLAPGATTTVTIVAQANCAYDKKILNTVTVSATNVETPVTASCCSKVD